MAEKIKLSEREHPYYKDKIDLWNLYQAAVRGGDDIINEDNLFTHRLEESTDYSERLERAYFLNLCELVPNTYNHYIFKETIERHPNEKLAEFRKNTNRRGSTIDDFIKKAGFYSKAYGAVHALVDMPASTKNRVTKAEAKKGKMYPYCTLIYPQQLKDWSLDADGNFNWVLLESLHYEDMDPKIAREEQKHYKLITRDEWWIEDEDGKKVSFKDGRPSNGPNPIPGKVPMITLYAKDTDREIVGDSLLKDIVYINIAILNWCSCIDEQIERQTFSQLVVPDDGTLAEESETGDDPLHRIGTSSIWTFNANAAHPPNFISPNVENINVIWKIVLDHAKEIFRLAGLLGSSDDMYVSQSGRAAQMGFVGVNSTLADTAKNYEKFENDISKLVLEVSGASTDDYQDVKYPSSFDIKALSDDIDDYFKIMERNLSPVLNKQIMKTISRRVSPQSPPNIKKEIEDEIDAGDGIVNPPNKFQQPVDMTGEDGNPNSNLGKSFRTKDKLEKEETSHRVNEDET